MKNLKLSGKRNIRDLGGMPTKEGVIKENMLLRASHLNGLKQKDIDVLVTDHHLKTVLDVRTSAEKDELPNTIVIGVDYQEMPVFDDSLPGMTHESKQDLDGVPDLKELYAQVMQGECMKNLAEIIRFIVEGDDEQYAVLYHCTEGKDRTGIITAVLLLLLGVDRQLIMEDYLFTNTVNRPKAVKYFLLVNIFKLNPKAAKSVYNVYLAKEEYLKAVFDAIDTTYGGEAAFIRDVLQISDESLAAFRKRMIQ